MTSDSYEVSAKYYDAAYAAKPDLVDLPFYVELAKRVSGPVLEMGCGTGRVLLPTARAGVEIHGLEAAPAMLAVLRDRVAREPGEVRHRITLHQGDMRTFRSVQKYALVTIPFRPMQHMYAVEDHVSALRTATFHLQEDGILAFDVFFPKFELLASGMGEERLELEWPGSEGQIVRRYFRKDSLDRVNQIFTATFFFRTYEGEKLVRQETEPLKMSWYTYPQLRALFLASGLEVVEEYGSFAKAKLDNAATDMIFLLQKA